MTSPAGDAWQCAAAAATRAGVQVREAASFEDVSLLLQRVWRADHPAEIASPGLLRTYAHSGNYVAGAYRGDRLIGASVGFFGRDEGTQHLHSYVAGVEPGSLGRGVGFALKQHQRAWTLARGIAEVRWTYDPLVLRNAHFNLGKLGARAVRYLPEFYGTMIDGINSGDLSDRLLLVWRLDAPEVIAAARGTPVEVTAAGSGQVRVEIPADVEELRRHDPAAATAWRLAVREAMAGRMAAGWRVAGVSRDGCYLLTEEA